MAALLFPELLGGIGLFLLGIVLLTGSLQSLSGGRLREAMQRVAGTKWRAFGTATGLTAIIQSASATIIMMLSLTAAGVLGSTASIAVILGANLGGTSTAWLVALFGLRFSVSSVALPLLAVGAFMRLLSKGRTGAVGMVLAGFGLLFVGIDFLQDGMASLAPDLRSTLPSHATLRGALALVVLGMITTTLVQSASVTVATTLAAVAAGGVSLEAGGYLVLGQNLGTTVTTVLAGLGTSTTGRRAAVAHVGMNALSGIVVFVLFRPVLTASAWAAGPFGGSDVVALAAFFTLLNAVNAAIFMPLAGRVAGIVERVVPERRGGLALHLDEFAAEVPDAAVEAVRRALAEVGGATLRVVRARLEHGHLPHATERRLALAREGWGRIEAFMARLDHGAAGRGHPSYGHLMLALDRLDELLAAGAREGLHVDALSSGPLRVATTRLRDALEAADAWLGSSMEETPEGVVGVAEALAEIQRLERPEVITSVATADADVAEAMQRLEALHWLAGVARPLERLVHHLRMPSSEARESAEP